MAQKQEVRLCGTSSTLSGLASSQDGQVEILLPAPVIIQPISRKQAHCFLEEWHYLHGAPSGVTYAYGLFGKDLGAVCCFMPPANKDCSTWLGVRNEAVIELIRLARATQCALPMSGFIARCLSALRRDAPRLDVCVSYADPAAGHKGIVYQAAGFIPLGVSRPRKKAVINGKMMHGMSFPRGRSAERADIWEKAEKVIVPPKWRYAIVLASGRRGYNLRRHLWELSSREMATVEKRRSQWLKA